MTVQQSQEFLRSGFWRRFAAFLLDAACVLLPLQILVAVLYAQTGGYIQGNFGLTYSYCTALTALPPGLRTQIEKPTHAADCHTTLFGFDTSRVLVISQVEASDVATTTLSESFWLNSDGQLTDKAGHNVTWMAVTLLFVYLVAMEAHYGRTLGKMATGVWTILRSAPQRRGIGLGRAIARRFAWQLGAIPLLLTQIPMLWPGFDAEAMSGLLNSPAYLSAYFAALAVFAAWSVWIAISMARKRDPIYDRIVGTSVIRKRA